MSDSNYNVNFIKYILIATLIMLLDLLTKHLIFSYLENIAIINQDPNPKIILLPFLNIVYVINKGISFGMFNNIDNAHILLSILQGSITAIILYILYKSKDIYHCYAFSIIIGGALGNVIDRIINGGVADFIDFHYNNYHWPAFNLADSAIFIGVVMLLIKDLIIKNKE